MTVPFPTAVLGVAPSYLAPLTTPALSPLSFPMQMAKHCSIYEEHGFATVPMYHRVLQLTRPKFGEIQAPVYAEKFKVSGEELEKKRDGGASDWRRYEKDHKANAAWVSDGRPRSGTLGQE